MHIQPLLDTMQETLSGERAQGYVAEIARYHRIQASPGYRAAAQWLAETARAAGLSVTVERFPAREGVHFWTLPSFQEWNCTAATLDWLRPGGEERLCDFAAEPVSVVQRSRAVQGEFEVVDVGDGDAAAYAGQEVSGKLVLSRSLVRETYRRAVVERGAAGVLFDHITGKAPGRDRAHLPGARQYASFWWLPEDEKSWGFVLTPRQGDRIRQSLAAGERVVLRAAIDSRFYDGELEAVVATIPGQGEGSVLGIAHLCHPQGFANDNASGAACLLEMAASLQRLIDAGDLSRPQRTIHCLWIPEMTGTYAWLQAHEDRIPGIASGINLDMVGEDQASTGAVMVLERPPEAMSSFAPDLLERLRVPLLKEQANLGGTERYPLIRHAVTGFSGGSDHMITSDPAVGIPTPMLIQWPDRYYHTTLDTLDRVDPRSLWRAGVLAGSYLYWLATAGAQEAAWLGWEMVAAFEQRLSRETQAECTRLLPLPPEEQAAGWRRLLALNLYRQQRMFEALASLSRLSDAPLAQRAWQQDVEEIADRVLDRSRRQIRPKQFDDEPAGDAWREHAAQFVPVRRYRGPIMDLASPHPPFALNEADARAWRELYAEVEGWRMLRVFAEFWADGRRTLAEIARLVALETGREIGPAIETYFRLLESAGVLRMERKDP